jgi:hypothetical protein
MIFTKVKNIEILKKIILEFKKDQEYEIENSNESRSFDTKKSRKSASRKTAPIINPSNVMGNINSRIMRNSKANDIYGKFSFFKTKLNYFLIIFDFFIC